MEKKLSSVKVEEIMNLIVEKPSIVNEDASINEIFDKIIEDPASRHVYIVDDKKKLVGSIRLNNIIELLFPETIAIESSKSLNRKDLEYSLKLLTKNNKEKASDIMNRKPKFVYRETNLDEMVTILVKEGINELPVINKESEIIGEVNILEIISFIRNNF